MLLSVQLRIKLKAVPIYRRQLMLNYSMFLELHNSLTSLPCKIFGLMKDLVLYCKANMQEITQFLSIVSYRSFKCVIVRK